MQALGQDTLSPSALASEISLLVMRNPDVLIPAFREADWHAPSGRRLKVWSVGHEGTRKHAGEMAPLCATVAHGACARRRRRTWRRCLIWASR